jgi:ADP-ribosylglycohydrolase
MNPPIARQLILPSLCADALALGSHWIYNPAKIARLYPDGARNYDDPRTDYHPGKSAGDFTHYGDQTLAVLKSVVLRGGFDAEGWREDWQRFWKSDPPSYRDGATKATIGFLERGVDAASESNDLAGASRIAPVIAALAGQPLDARIAAARAQTALTHGDRATIDAAGFFTRVVDAIASGKTITQALDAAASARHDALDARDFLNQAQAAIALDVNAAGEKFGITCHTPEAFPLTLWFLLRYSDKPLEALVANTMAGGDNAARGMLIGLVMGAAHGLAWLPPHWVEALCAHDEIDALLTLLEP